MATMPHAWTGEQIESDAYINITKYGTRQYRWAILDQHEPTQGAPSGTASNITAAINDAACKAIDEGLKGEIIVDYRGKSYVEYVGAEIIHHPAVDAPVDAPDVKTDLTNWSYERAQRVAKTLAARVVAKS